MQNSMHGLVALIARHRVLAVGLVLLVMPFVVPYEALSVNILIFGLFAIGFNVLFGYTGLLSFGHAAFFGLGGYGTGIVMVQWGWPWYFAILLGVVVATLAGAAMGALAIRSKGIYFSMVTLALGQCVYYIIYKSEGLTGGENGLRNINVKPLHFGGVNIDLINPLTKYYVVLVFVMLALWLVSRVLASPFGAVLEAVRENERRAAACGYNVALTKLLAFVISAAICGLAGALRALHLAIVPIDSLHYLTSGQVVMTTLLGGMGTFFGPIVGAAVFLLAEDLVTNITRYWQGVVGVIFIGFVLFFPRGIWGSILHWVRKRPA